MAIQTKLAAEIETAGSDDDDGTSDVSDDGPDRPELSPFSMDYDTGSYSVDSKDMNNALTALVAVTNLL